MTYRVCVTGSPGRSTFGTSDGDWLHDKFEEMEGAEEGGGDGPGTRAETKEEDTNQPSSTTEVTS